MRMMKRTFIALLVIALATANHLEAAPPVRESLAKWSHGKRIEIVLNNGERLVGRLGAVQFDSFGLDPDKKLGTARILRFDEVRSVSTKMTKAEKWGIAAAVYAALVIIGLVL
ncbi:MAG: hypothetical protein M3Z09_03170 [Acidobacteriota bacterium]|nr:hypothetical protein [Acidobacteriota bacterium]